MPADENDVSDENATLLKIVATEVVRPSFEHCCRHGDSFFDSFYSNLADHLPDVGPMFAGVDMTRQNELLRAGIGHLIGHSEGRPDSVAELEWLGVSHRHGGLNVPKEWYPQWADTLCQTIREHDGTVNDNTMTAWHVVLSRGIARMVAMYE